MPEIAADPPSPSCYRLFSGSGIQEFQRFGPDLFYFARTRYAVGAVLPLSALTDKDRGDLEFGLAMGADWVALPLRPQAIRACERRASGRRRRS
jgi:hypothetical protein